MLWMPIRSCSCYEHWVHVCFSVVIDCLYHFVSSYKPSVHTFKKVQERQTLMCTTVSCYRFPNGSGIRYFNDEVHRSHEVLRLCISLRLPLVTVSLVLLTLQNLLLWCYVSTYTQHLFYGNMNMYYSFAIIIACTLRKTDKMEYTWYTV